MDTSGTRELSQTHDARLNFLLGDAHQFGQLIDHNHNVGQFRRHIAIRGFNFAEHIFLLFNRAIVKALDIAHLHLFEHRVAFFHLLDGPAQTQRHLFGIGDDRHHEMFEVFVGLELECFRVDENHTHLLRGAGQQQSGQQGVHTDGFTRAGGPGDQHMRHAGEVADNQLAGHIGSERERQRHVGIVECLAFRQLAQEDRRAFGVGDFNTDRPFAGNRSLNANALRAQGQRDVAFERGDFFDAHAGRRSDFIGGDRRAGFHVSHFALYAELLQSGL